MRPIKRVFAFGFKAFHLIVKHRNSLFKRTQERVFLFFHHASNEFALGFQFRISIAHFVNKCGQQLKHKCRTLPQEGVSITNGTAKNAANNISSLSITRQLSVGDGESHSSKVVGNNAHGHIHFLIGTILHAREARNLLYYGLEHIGIIVRGLTLQRAHKAFEAHTRINYVHWQRLQRPVGLAIKLHKHDVPYFNNLWVVLVNKTSARHFCFFFGRTRIEMNFRTRATRSSFAHLPEVVVFVSVDDMVGRQVFRPIFCGFVVACNTFFVTTFKHRNI